MANYFERKVNPITGALFQLSRNKYADDGDRYNGDNGFEIVVQPNQMHSTNPKSKITSSVTKFTNDGRDTQRDSTFVPYSSPDENPNYASQGGATQLQQTEYPQERLSSPYRYSNGCNYVSKCSKVSSDDLSVTISLSSTS